MTGGGEPHIYKRMDRAQIIARLRGHQRELRAAGVLRLSLFGSVARGEAGPDSDVDVVVKLDPRHPVDLFQFYRLADRLESVLNAKVDLVCEPIERPTLRERVERDRAHVF
jgi:predicted nucleotidyltransferase